MLLPSHPLSFTDASLKWIYLETAFLIIMEAMAFDEHSYSTDSALASQALDCLYRIPQRAGAIER